MRTHRRTRLASLAVLALCAGCAARSSVLDAAYAAPAQEYRGHYTAGAGSSWFRRCGAPAAEAAWWVTVTGAATAQVDSARRAGRLVDGARTFVRWRAVPAPPGEVGPPGSSALLVREVLAMRPAAADDCAAP